MLMIIKRWLCFHKYEYECTMQECRKCGHIKHPKWNGSSSLANQLFGEKYGEDWEYLSNEAIITKSGNIYKIGETIREI